MSPFHSFPDFGLAQYIPDEIYKENLRGSPLYMAPEILLAKKYNYKVDLWSVGIILYECLYGRPPLAHKSCKELLESLKNEMTIKVILDRYLLHYLPGTKHKNLAVLFLKIVTIFYQIKSQ